MGSILSIPASFVANTRAKSAEVNAKFSAVYNALAAGTHDPWFNGVTLNPLSNANVDVTASACYFNAMHTIDTNATYTLKAATSKMVILGELTINTGGALYMTAGATLLII